MCYAMCAAWTIGLVVSSAAPTETASPVRAVALPRFDLDLGFVVRGRVEEILTEPGADVRKGEPLVRLANGEGAAQIALYRLRSASTLEVDAAEAEWRMDLLEESTQKGLFDQGDLSVVEIERIRSKTVRSRLAYELFKQRWEEAKIQLTQAEAQHEQFTLRAPIDGRVEAVRIEKGEMVDEVKPVLRLVVIDPLWIDAPVPVSEAVRLHKGGAARVRFASLADAPPVEGRIIHVGSVADPGSETVVVRVELPNPERLPGGSHVLVTFETESPTAR